MNTQSLPAFNLSGRIALVTGASKGMGRSIAAILAQAGARVVISSRNQADCDRVAAEISPDPGQCVGIAADIGDSQTLQRLVAATQSKIGKPDILVCNAAGEAPIGSLDKVEATVFDEAMISNVRNNLLLANLVAPDMVARRDGSIIIMSSIVGSRGRPGVGVYATTKAAVNQLVRTMAVEWGPFQVRPMRSLRPPCAPISHASSGTLPTRWHALRRAYPWVGLGKPTMSQGSLCYWPHPRAPSLTAKSSA
jgi:NAD(P)-dependent dehydrogenase (short-subunit alcohol dehydrogenase family)